MTSSIEQKIFKNIENSANLNSWFSQLLWKKNLFNCLINAVPVALLLLNENQKVVFSNRTASKYFNLESKWLKNSLVDIVKASRYQEVKLAVTTLLDPNEQVDFVEFNIMGEQIRDLVIKYFPYSISTEDLLNDPALENCSPTFAEAKDLFPWIKSGKLKLIVLLDITEWKNRSLKQHQEQSINSLNILTAGIAHEIKNPLGALDLHMQLIKRFIKSHEIEDKEELEDLIQIVNEEMSRLESIVNDFLFSFRPLQPNKSPNDLNEIIKNTLQILSPKLEDKKIDFRLILDPDVKSFFFDADQIKQMIINMINNSIEGILEDPAQHDANTGLIEIKTKELEEKIVLEIQDNGIGIDLGKFTEIFQPFYTSKKMGTGLGLSIVTKIIHEHNGEIILNQDEANSTGVGTVTGTGATTKGVKFTIEFYRIRTKTKLLESEDNDDHTP